MRKRNRNRVHTFAAVAVTIATGLVSRHFFAGNPAWLAKYPGDALWALMAFFGWGFFVPLAATLRVAALALVTCFGVEVLKLYQAPWIVAVRHSTLGYLVLGHAFSWENFVAYTVGVVAGVAIEVLHNRTENRDWR